MSTVERALRRRLALEDLDALKAAADRDDVDDFDALAEYAARLPLGLD